MSIASIIGLSQLTKDLPPEIGAVLEPILEHVINQVEKQTGEMVRTSLEQVNGIVGAALDRINGMQFVVVCTVTVKLPEVGSKIAEILPSQS